MKQCSVCKREFSDKEGFCPHDGQSLTASVAQDPLIGYVLDEKYTLDAKIGEGGMGKVYRGTHLMMDSTVAIKVLHSEMASDQTAFARFRQEARAAAQIRHQNAVVVTDFGVARDLGIAYLVMEFLEGQELRERIQEQRSIGIEESARIMTQACAGIHAAHSRGIIHRDLKPDNIWLVKTNDGNLHVKVLDFGIAKLKSFKEAGNLTEQGMIIGTPFYMSPEQCKGEELEAQSDIYSLGVILYEMLTGQVPFKAPNPLTIVNKHINEKPVPLSQHRKDIPAEVEEVVLRALEKDVNRRQSSALQLADELNYALGKPGMTDRSLSTTTGSKSPVGTMGGGITDTGDGSLRGNLTGDQSGAGLTAGGNLSGNANNTVSDPSVQTNTINGMAMPSPTLSENSTKIMGSRLPVAESVPPVSTKELSSAAVSSTVSGSSAQAEKKKKTSTFIVVAITAAIAAFASIFYLSVLRQTGSSEPGTNRISVPPKMKLINGGAFKLGTDDIRRSAEGRDINQGWRPAHEVTISTFFLDLYEVSNEDYQRFVRQKGYQPPSHWTGEEFPKGEAKLPVYNVTWNDANAYCEWTGKRLPTEAEWEYAARGTGDLLYPWGNEWSAERANSGEDRKGIPVAIGSFPAGVSPFGIFDMAGNVAEWVQDDYKPYPGSSAPPIAGQKVFRGGSYLTAKDDLIIPARFSEYPIYSDKYLGFRCAQGATSGK